jgi:hypothetical protein
MNDLKEIIKTKNKTKNKNKNKNKNNNNNNNNETCEEPEKYTKYDSLDSCKIQDTQLHKDKLNSAFKESIKVNKWFYLSWGLCFYMFKQSNPDNTSYITLVISYILMMITGHMGHRISHNMNFTDTYNKYKKNNINPLENILLKFCRFLDFHSITHHDTTINKQTENILYEFLNNVITQGGAIVIFVKLINYFIDFRVVMLWALMYATTHNINYLFIKPSTHRDHHFHDDTNYGIDIADILFDTKHDLDDIETHNHVSINLIIITLVIIYFTKNKFM